MTTTLNDNELIALLESQAQEIATEGHNGWGNTMLAASAALRERLDPPQLEKDAEIVDLWYAKNRIAQLRLYIKHPHEQIAASSPSSLTGECEADNSDLITATQMMQATRDLALEEAAKVVEGHKCGLPMEGAQCKWIIAADLRALKSVETK